MTSPLTSCVGFSLSASTLMVVNKLIIESLPMPSLVCLLQLLVTASFVLVLGALRLANVDGFECRKVRSFQTFVGLFTCTLFTS